MIRSDIRSRSDYRHYVEWRTNCPRVAPRLAVQEDVSPRRIVRTIVQVNDEPRRGCFFACSTALRRGVYDATVSRTRSALFQLARSFSGILKSCGSAITAAIVRTAPRQSNTLERKATSNALRDPTRSSEVAILLNAGSQAMVGRDDVDPRLAMHATDRPARPFAKRGDICGDADSLDIILVKEQVSGHVSKTPRRASRPNRDSHADA